MLVRRPAQCHESKLLTLEGDYSLATIRRRHLEHIITIRDLEGFFTHVWSVYPFVGADAGDHASGPVGPPSSTSVSSRHTVIEGHTCFSHGLRFLPILNFLFAQASLVVRLNRLIQTEGISVVRASEPYYLGMLGLLLARWNRLPFVVRLIANYDSDFWSDGRPIYPRLFRWRSVEKRIDRFVLPRADLVAAGNEDILRYAEANGAAEERSTVFPVGCLIEPVHFLVEPAKRPSVRPGLGLEDRPFLICVSRLEPVKHPEDIVRVTVQAKEQVPGLACVIVGEGSMQDELERMVAQANLRDDLIFAGNRDQEWIARAFASANVVLSPLTGRALVEAALSGTPIVAYDVDWHSELVRTGETGILVPYRDADQMAAAVVDILADPVRAALLGAAGRAFALKVMDPARLLEHERDAYRKVLAGNTGCLPLEAR